MLFLIFISCLSGKDSSLVSDSFFDSQDLFVENVECRFYEDDNLLLNNEYKLIIENYDCSLSDVDNDKIAGTCFASRDDWYLFVYDYPEIEIETKYTDTEISGGLFYENIEKTNNGTDLLSIGWDWKEPMAYGDGGNDLIDISNGERLARIEDDEIGFPLQGIISENYWIVSASNTSNDISGIVLLFDVDGIEKNINKNDAEVIHYGNLAQGAMTVVDEVGDVDGDGFSDFELFNFNQFGIITFDELINYQGIEQTIYFPTTGYQQSLTGVSDWNGDGLDDVAIIGDISPDTSGGNAGVVTIFNVLDVERIVSYYQTDPPGGGLTWGLYNVEDFLLEGTIGLFVKEETFDIPIYWILSPGDCGVNNIKEASVVSWEIDGHYDSYSVGAENDFIYMNSFYGDSEEDYVDIYFKKL